MKKRISGRGKHGLWKHNFYAAVTIEPNGCLVWNGAMNEDGYGVAYACGRVIKAHRLSWILHNGQLTPGLVLDHLCRNRACVNPTHLEEVTQKLNLHRGNTNVHKTHCPRGHEYDQANTYRLNGGRYCRKCNGIRGAEFRARRLAAGMRSMKAVTQEAA